jgi:hypothetical protein
LEESKAREKKDAVAAKQSQELRAKLKKAFISDSGSVQSQDVRIILAMTSEDKSLFFPRGLNVV